MKAVTLDILDADLQADYDKYVAMDYEDREKLFTHGILVDPRRSEDAWAQIQHLLDDLEWETVRYFDARRDGSVDDMDAVRPGVYLFTVRPEKTILGLPHFTLYVGIAGEHGSERPLRERLRDQCR